MMDSSRFTERNLPTTVAQTLQKYFNHFYWARDYPGVVTMLGNLDTIWCKSMILVSQKLEKSRNERCSRVPSTPTTKIYAGNEVSRPKSLTRKKKFQKIFFAIFSTFFDTSTSQFSRFSRFGDVSVPNMTLY